ncbi:phage exclusion protein Lit family protein [Pokkaliibacter sp. CJK22405]|uniref:phage exclusion protein Lit family protein n=1 Tax=Pokkaliibacter sp. CJK22405 TaxID=3384615 RepID=UPI003984CBA4
MEEINIIRRLFDGVIPERSSEIEAIIIKYGPQFRMIKDREGFNLKAGAYSVIQYTQRSARQIWIFGYAGLQALYCYSSYIRLLKSSNESLDIDRVDKIFDQALEDEKFKIFLEFTKNLNSVFHEDDFTWPSGIPEPEKGRPEDPEHALVYDLTCMATAFTLLHELKHVIFSVEKESPGTPIDEEYRCDAFAKEMMISKIHLYAELSGYAEDKVRTKRMMGIALASAFILFATGKEHVFGSNSHPPVHGRWLELVEDMSLPDDDWMWLYFSSLFLALLKYYSIKISPKIVKSYKSLFLDLIEDLDNGIPRS